MHEFVTADGLNCLISVGTDADQNYQNYILRGKWNKAVQYPPKCLTTHVSALRRLVFSCQTELCRRLGRDATSGIIKRSMQRWYTMPRILFEPSYLTTKLGNLMRNSSLLSALVSDIPERQAWMKTTSYPLEPGDFAWQVSALYDRRLTRVLHISKSSQRLNHVLCS